MLSTRNSMAQNELEINKLYESFDELKKNYQV